MSGVPDRVRSVLDTNVIISGLINAKGPPGRVLRAFKDGKFILVTSRKINEEVLEVMDRPRLRDKYGLGEHLFDVAFLLWERAEIVPAPPRIRVSRDPADDKFLAAGAGGLAHYLVTGDIKDLLALGEFRGMRIVSPERFLSVLYPS